MILKGWHIESYGIFSDRTLDDLGPGITVLHGPNEAGKTTLLNFIRGALFEYPRKTQAGYVPNLGSGTHGGRLFLENDQGPWTLERRVTGNRVTLTRPDGSTAEPSELAPLLHHADRTLFNSVFTCSLTDLIALDGKDAQQVRDRLFSAGISGAGRSASELGTQLSGELGKLYKKGGKNQELNLLLVELEEADRLRKELEAQAREYPERRGELQELRKRVEELRSERDSAAAEVARLEILGKLRPLLAERDQKAGTLKELDAPATFPKSGLDRADAALARLRDAGLKLQDLERAEVGLKAKLEELPIDEARCAKGSEVDFATEALASYSELMRQKEELSGELQTAQDDFERTLKAIGNRWTRELVAEVDTGTERQDEAQRLGRTLTDARQELDYLKREAAQRSAPATVATTTPSLPLFFGAAVLIVAFGFFIPEQFAIASWVAAALLALYPLLQRGKGGVEQPSKDEALREAGEKAETLEQKWSASLAEWGLGEGAEIAPDTAMRLFTQLRAAQGEEATLTRDERKAEGLAEELKRRGEELTESFGLAADLTGEPLIRAVRDELRGVKEALETRANHLRLKEELDRTVATAQRERDVTEEADSDLSTLFDAVGAEDAESFRELAQRHGQRAALENELQALALQITTLVGEGEEAEELVKQARRGLQDERRNEYLAAAQRKESLDTELDESNRKFGALEQELGEQENSTRLAECRARIEALREEAGALARRWRVTALARSLVRTTLDDYTAKNQPEALARASALFKELTAGRYNRVVHSPEDNSLKVCRPDGAQLGPEELSRGTREGLYICLRLALAGQYGARTGKLPLVMDDVLVNLDPARAAATLKAIARFAGENQVLFFTCHPETAARVNEVDPGARMIDL